MKRLCRFIFGLVVCIVSVNTAYASTYYTNTNGVEFTEDQYNYISELYYDGYQEYITKDDFDILVNNNLFDSRINYVEESYINDNNELNGNGSITQNGRTLKLSSSCSSICVVVIKATWNGSATVKSWDVIGARTINSTINNYGTTVVTGTGYSQTYTNPQIYTNGFGYSALYPNTSNVVFTTTIYMGTSGSIRGSYQHAMTNISEANSKLYTIATSGYGGVFSFYGAASGVYDNANGLTLALG